MNIQIHCPLCKHPNPHSDQPYLKCENCNQRFQTPQPADKAVWDTFNTPFYLFSLSNMKFIVNEFCKINNPLVTANNTVFQNKKEIELNITEADKLIKRVSIDLKKVFIKIEVEKHPITIGLVTVQTISDFGRGTGEFYLIPIKHFTVAHYFHHLVKDEEDLPPYSLCRK